MSRRHRHNTALAKTTPPVPPVVSPPSQEDGDGVGMMMAIRQLGSALVERLNLARRAGITFGGQRDVYDALGYKKQLSFQDFVDRFARNEVAARIVEIYPKETWRGGADVIESDDPTRETPFEQAVDELDRRVKIWTLLERLDTLARLGQYAVLLIGAPGKFDTPLTKVNGVKDIAYLTPFGEDEAMIDETSLVKDEHDPRYGLPDFYTLTRVGGSQNVVGRRVHHSRIFHCPADGQLSDPLRGQPCLERVWNRLDDLEKVVGAGSEAFWMRAHQGYVAEFDKDVKMSQAQIDAARDKAEEFAHQLRRTIAFQGGEFKALGSDVADFQNPVDSILTLLAGGTGIPKRLLFGSERGELASTQDSTRWERRIKDRRLEHAEPFIARPFFDRMIAINALPAPEAYHIRWPGVDNLDDAGKADVASKWAALNAKMKTTVVIPDEIRERVLGLPPLHEVNPDLPEFDGTEISQHEKQVEEDEEEESDDDQESQDDTIVDDGDDPPQEVAAAHPLARRPRSPRLRIDLSRGRVN